MNVFRIEVDLNDTYQGFQIMKRGPVGVIRQLFGVKERDLALLGNTALIIIKRPEQLLAEMTEKQKRSLISQGHELAQYLCDENFEKTNYYRIYEDMVESRINLKCDTRAAVIRKD